MSIVTIRHPDYDLTTWEKYRKTLNGGDEFINAYLVMFSNREDPTDFTNRKRYTYCPAHTKSELNKIKNAIYQRLSDITRAGGPDSYQLATQGLNGGVDRKGASLTNFFGGQVLPELLALGKVGIYLDRPEMETNLSRADVLGYMPYAYLYHAESILSWTYDLSGTLSHVLLRDVEYIYDEESGLPKSEDYSFRYLAQTDSGVDVKFYTKDGTIKEQLTLDLPRLPFYICEIPESLLTDVANYQIALLNLGSSDINYALKSNFPFYVEQYTLAQLMQESMRAETEGTNEDATTSREKPVKLGSGQGRRYLADLDQPSFIHPSPEPLKVSMEKQESMRQEIKQLMQMTLAQLDEAQGTVDSGLSYIGGVLEQAERNFARIWSDYEIHTEDVTIKYPRNYTLQSDAERRKEAQEVESQISKTPSMTLKRELAKQVAHILIGTKVEPDKVETIDNEIETAEVIVIDPDVLKQDHESGFVGTELASKLRGYPAGQVEQAKKDHAERAMRIAAAQSSVTIAGAARGVPDNSITPVSEASGEKTTSRETSLEDTSESRVRGDGK